MLQPDAGHWTRRWLALAALVLAVLGLSLFVGRYPKPYWMPPSLLWEDDLARRLTFSLRLPRILAAFIVGMSLAAAGSALQIIFRNPMVSPGFMGVTQGAAFGAALSIIFISNAPLVVETTATLFAFLGLLVAYGMASRIHYGDWVLRLVLAGIVSSALFSAGLGLLKYMADPLKELPEITFWLLGGLWTVDWTDLLYMLPFVISGLVVLLLMSWRLNLLALRDETAHSLGVSPSRERFVVVLASVSVTAATVAVAGMIGWLGLIVPHLARRLVGADAQRLLPASMLIGGVFCVLCDDVGRTLLAGEVPLGILTSLFGSALFALLFMRRGGQGLR